MKELPSSIKTKELPTPNTTTASSSTGESATTASTATIGRRSGRTGEAAAEVFSEVIGKVDHVGTVVPLGLVLHLVQDGLEFFGPLMLNAQGEGKGKHGLEMGRCHVRRIEQIESVFFRQLQVHAESFDPRS